MNLISKKDLLAATGISYGQLYRWKRQRLIPEEWFIKQSSYTGQETFFPREQILSRIKSIQELKDRYSLDELAEILSPQSSGNTFSREEARGIAEIDPALLASLPAERKFTFSELALLAVLSSLSLPMEARASLAVRAQPAGNVKTCTVFEAEGRCYLAFSHGMEPISFDPEIRAIKTFSLEEAASKLRTKYKDLPAK